MRKGIACLCFLLALFFCAAGAAEGFSLPDGLTALQDEALRGTDLTGVLVLPDTLETLGDHVFDDTGLYALDIPAGVTSIGEQSFAGNGAAYVILRGDPELGDFEGARYLFCAGDTQRSGAMPLETIVSDGVFYYVNVYDLGLSLLCAVDNTAVPEQVSIPDFVQGLRVKWLASDVLIGCPQVKAVSLPFAVGSELGSAFVGRADVAVTLRHGLEMWWADGTDAVNCDLLEGFRAANPQYADWSFYVENVGEGDAAACIADGDTPDLFTFAQDQLAGLALMGALSDVPAAYRAGVLDDDAGAVAAATLDGRLLAYPITSDNGYFLFYDANIITDPTNLETILYDCERAGCTFHMDLTSGWYNAAFFYGAGCELSYDYENGVPVAFHGTLATQNGLNALKAMIKVASWPNTFVNGSTADTDDPFMAALVSGVWDGEAFAEYCGNDTPAAAKLPSVDGFQLGSFGGFKLIGVRASGDSGREAAAHALAAWLSSADAQTQRQNEAGWMASDPQARSRAEAPWYFSGLAAQQAYAHPQGQFPGEYWSIAEALGTAVISGDLNDLSDTELMEVLQQYQNDLAALVQ